MGTVIIAGVLLIVRLVAVHFMAKVLRIQVGLLRRPIEEDIWDFRKTLHYLSLAFMASNILPIALDGLVVLQGVGVLQHIRTEAFVHAYAISNAIGAVVMAIAFYKMYKLAQYSEEIDVLERKHVADNK